MQYAGQMQPGDGDGEVWFPADARIFSRLTYPDYFVRIGLDRGFGIGMFKVPEAPGWSVRLTDDPDADDLPDAPMADNPPTEPPPPPVDPDPPPEDTRSARKRR